MPTLLILKLKLFGPLSNRDKWVLELAMGRTRAEWPRATSDQSALLVG